jgi:hypothetical protein
MQNQGDIILTGGNTGEQKLTEGGADQKNSNEISKILHNDPS